MPRSRHAVLGGTFDRFHAGHAALLDRAFRVGTRVSIGVTTDAYLAEHSKPLAGRIRPYAARRRAVVAWVRRHHPGRAVRVAALENPFGRSVDEGIDVLVVSADTVQGGGAVNVERRRLGRRPVRIEVVPLVLADDLLPVSSRRVRAGEIDVRGRRRSTLRIGLAVTEPGDLSPARAAIRSIFPRARIAARLVRGSRSPDRAARDARSLARTAVRGQEIGIAIARNRPGHAELVERRRALELDPRPIRGTTAASVRREISRALRPGPR